MPKSHSSPPSDRGFENVNLEPATIEEFDALVEAAGKISVTPTGRYKGSDAKFVSSQRAKQVKESARVDRHTLKKSEKEDAQKKIGLADKYGIGPWTEGAEELKSKVALSEALGNRERMLKDELDRVRKIAAEELKSRSPFIEFGGETLALAQRHIEEVVERRRDVIAKNGGPEGIEKLRERELAEFAELEKTIRKEAENKLRAERERLLIDVGEASDGRPKAVAGRVSRGEPARPVISDPPAPQRGRRAGEPDVLFSRGGDNKQSPVIGSPPPRLPQPIRPARPRPSGPHNRPSTPPAPVADPVPPRNPDPVEVRRRPGDGFEVLVSPNTDRPGYMLMRSGGKVVSRPYGSKDSMWGVHDVHSIGGNGMGLALTSFRHEGYGDGGSEDGLVVDVESGFFAVLDGVGGEGNGRRAMEIATQVLADSVGVRYPVGPFKDAGTAKKSLSEYARSVELSFEEDGSIGPEDSVVGSLVALVDGPHGGRSLVAATFGDTRVLVVRGKEVISVTKDQSIGNNVWNTLSRPSGMASVAEFALQPGDRVIVCSDGISGDWGVDNPLGKPNQFWSDDPEHLGNSAGGPSILGVVSESASLADLAAGLVEGSRKSDDKTVIVIDPFAGQQVDRHMDPSDPVLVARRRPTVASAPGATKGGGSLFDVPAPGSGLRSTVVLGTQTVGSAGSGSRDRTGRPDPNPSEVGKPLIGAPPPRQSGSTLDARPYRPSAYTSVPPEGPFTGPSIADRVVDGVSGLVRRGRRPLGQAAANEPFRPVGYAVGSTAPVGPFAEGVDAPSGTEQPSLVRGTLAPVPSTSGQTPIVNTGGLVPPLPQDGTSRIVGTLPLDTARSLDDVQKTALVDEVFGSVPPRAREIAKDRGYDLGDPEFKDRFSQWFSWGERAPEPGDLVDFISSLNSEPTLVSSPEPKTAPTSATVAPPSRLDPFEDEEGFPISSPWAGADDEELQSDSNMQALEYAKSEAERYGTDPGEIDRRFRKLRDLGSDNILSEDLLAEDWDGGDPFDVGVVGTPMWVPPVQRSASLGEDPDDDGSSFPLIP